MVESPDIEEIITVDDFRSNVVSLIERLISTDVRAENIATLDQEIRAAGAVVSDVLPADDNDAIDRDVPAIPDSELQVKLYVSVVEIERGTCFVLENELGLVYCICTQHEPGSLRIQAQCYDSDFGEEGMVNPADIHEIISVDDFRSKVVSIIEKEKSSDECAESIARLDQDIQNIRSAALVSLPADDDDAIDRNAGVRPGRGSFRALRLRLSSMWFKLARVRPLLAQLEDRCWDTQYDAKRIIVRYGIVAVRPLLRLLRDNEPTVRRAAIVALGALWDRKHKEVREAIADGLPTLKDDILLTAHFLLRAYPQAGREMLLPLGDAHAIKPFAIAFVPHFSSGYMSLDENGRALQDMIRRFSTNQEQIAIDTLGSMFAGGDLGTIVP